MASRRDPNAPTPYTPEQLKELRRELREMTTGQLMEFYNQCLNRCQLSIDRYAPPPSQIQQFVQAWRELRKRQGNR